MANFGPLPRGSLTDLMLITAFETYLTQRSPGAINYSIILTKLCLRTWIIVWHFANCGVNSSYCSCKVVNHEKNVRQFFSQGKFSLSPLYPNYIHILLIYCMQLLKEICFIPKKVTLQKRKKCFSILKKTFACGRLQPRLCFAYFCKVSFKQ